MGGISRESALEASPVQRASELLLVLEKAMRAAGAYAEKGAIYSTLAVGVLLIVADEVCAIAAGTGEGFGWSFAEYVTSMSVGALLLVAGGLFGMYRWTLQRRTTQALAQTAFDEARAASAGAREAVDQAF